MAKVKLSPRQRMINMMYIVLIALLALNVDKQVLKAFHLMEKTFMSSTENYNAKNETQMAGFFQLFSKEKERAEPYYNSAIEAQKISKEFCEYIENLKKEVADLYGGRLEFEEGEDGLTSLRTPEGLEKHAHFFMQDQGGKRSKELQNKINATRDKLLGLLHPKNDSLFKTLSVFNQAENANTLNANEASNQGVSKKKWVNIFLEDQPAGALMAMLTQFQNNAKALEADVLNKLFAGVNTNAYIANELQAKIIVESNYVMEGEEFKAEVFLAASNSSVNPDIQVQGATLNQIERGIGQVSAKASGIGVKTVKGQIMAKDPKTGKLTPYTFEKEYQVFKPVATIAAEKMNLLYKGLENPLSISVPGFSAADVTVKTTSGARITGSNGKYLVTVDGTARNVTVDVYAAGRKMGSTKFRVRNVPAPNAQCGGIKNASIPQPKQVLCAQNNLLAFMGEDFAYDMHWRITSFKVIYKPNRDNVKQKTITGSSLQSVKPWICGANSGDIFFFEAIRAKDTKYGNTKKLDAFAVKIR